MFFYGALAVFLLMAAVSHNVRAGESYGQAYKQEFFAATYLLMAGQEVANMCEFQPSIRWVLHYTFLPNNRSVVETMLRAHGHISKAVGVNVERVRASSCLSLVNVMRDEWKKMQAAQHAHTPS